MKTKKTRFVAIITAGAILCLAAAFLHLYFDSLKRLDNFEKYREETALRDRMLVLVKQDIPDWISANQDLSEQDFLTYISKISSRKNFYILNDLSLWRNHLSDVVQDDEIAIFSESPSGLIGYRFSGKFEKGINIGDLNLSRKYTRGHK